MSKAKKLTRAEKQQINAAIQNARRQDKRHKSAQDSIPFQRMFPDGICRVTDHYYTKTVQFQDINYKHRKSIDDYYDELNKKSRGKYNLKLGFLIEVHSEFEPLWAIQKKRVKKKPNGLMPMLEDQEKSGA